MKVLAFAVLSVATGFGQGNVCDSLEDCQKIIQTKPHSSQAHYRIGEILFQEKNYREAAGQFQDALAGDLDPKWTEVWSHLQPGKIFDLIDQRPRALAEYRTAQKTKDNTRGALDEAAEYIETPYKGN